MRTRVFTDGFEGWTKRARARAKAMDQGRKLTTSREFTFQSAAEMARLLTPARVDLFEEVKKRSASIKDIAASLGRQVPAFRRDVSALEMHGILQSEHVVNPVHGRVRVVRAPAGIRISAELLTRAMPACASPLA